jgi:hypothetical protein
MKSIPGIVYIVRSEWIYDPITKVNPVKIGYTTKSVKKRFGSITEVPGEIIALGQARTKDCRTLEKNLQGILEQYRVAKEWFEPPQKVLDHAISILNNQDDSTIKITTTKLPPCEPKKTWAKNKNTGEVREYESQTQCGRDLGIKDSHISSAFSEKCFRTKSFGNWEISQVKFGEEIKQGFNFAKPKK